MDQRGAPRMNGIWRVVITLLLIGVPALWAPTPGADATNDRALDETSVYGLAESQRDDAKDMCKNANPRKQKKCHYNGWDNGNWRSLPNNENDDETVAAVPTGSSSASAAANGLTV